MLSSKVLINHFGFLCTVAPTSLDLVILNGASLEVNWEHAVDADVSLTYTVTVESENVEVKRANTTTVTLSGLLELAVYVVSVQALNCGGLSRSLTSTVRMVTIGQLCMTEAFELKHLNCSVNCWCTVIKLVCHGYISTVVVLYLTHISSKNSFPN